jgi:DNA polymerase-1
MTQQQSKMISQRTEHDRNGFAKRTHRVAATSGKRQVTTAQRKYAQPKPSQTQSTLDGDKQTRIVKEERNLSSVKSYEPGSDYALREDKILALVDDIFARGIRIDPSKVEDYMASGDCSDPMKSIKRNMTQDRVHPDFAVTDLTGRISFKKPNLGSLPKDPVKNERSVVIAEPGHVLFTADLAGIDARVVAALSQDPEYLEQFTDDRDIHLEMARIIFGDETRRSDAKALIHGINFGMGASKIGELAGMSYSEAKILMCKMGEQFPFWAAWRIEIAKDARLNGMLVNDFGRRVPVDRGKAHTQAASRLVQSTARDIFVDGLLRMDAAGLSPFIRLLMHDEVLMSVPEERFTDLARRTKDCMEITWAPRGAKHSVDITVRISHSAKNWADTQKAKERGSDHARTAH